MGREPWILVDSVPLEVGTVVTLEGEESRHVAGSLRLRPGDSLILADGCGRTADAVLRAVSGRRSDAEIHDAQVHRAPPGRGLTIALAVLHGQAMDWAVQKAVEVGVAILVPVVAERCQVRLKTARGRLGHWQRIARQAIKQCQRPWQMEVADPCSLADLLTGSGDRIGSVADPDGSRLGDLAGGLPDLLLVGPEGGFGPSDLELLDAVNWPKVRLGDFVLRAETAAIVGAAALVAARDRQRIE